MQDVSRCVSGLVSKALGSLAVPGTCAGKRSSRFNSPPDTGALALVAARVKPAHRAGTAAAPLHTHVHVMETSMRVSSHHLSVVQKCL